MASPVIIVRKIGDGQDAGSEPVAPDDVQRIEASLLPASRRLLMTFPVKGLERPFIRHLEQRIHRNPRDLLAHVRRLVLMRSIDDCDGVYGALIDLFLVLGYRGLPLRRRLLSLVRDKLSAEQTAFLHAHLEDGVRPADVSASTTRSCLSPHVTGSTALVTGPDPASGSREDLVAIARSSLAKGDDEAAQGLLEGALEIDPGSEEVCMELLSLYKRKRLQKAFKRTYASVLGRQLARPDLWQTLATRFQEERERANEQL